VIIWHSGEPLVVPIEFYDFAFRQFESVSGGRLAIEHWFQTNGTLISQKWCDFAQRWQIRIGVSVDGPEWLHNLHRVNKVGHGTFADVLRGINLLRSNK